MRGLILLGALAFGACGANTTYAPEEEEAFVTSCVQSGGAAAMCACTWDRIEAEIPRADYVAFERDLQDGRPNSMRDRLIAMGEECLAQAPGKLD